MSPGDRTPPIERDVAATAALTAYTLVVAAGFARVFSGWEFFADLALLAIVGHGASLALRRARLTGWIAIPAVAVLLVWALVLQHYRDTTTWLVPRGATWDRLDLEVGLVRDQFQTAVAPVLYGAGWATLAGFALVVIIVMSDSFAFRAEARGEALVPGGVLFVFIAALGSPRLRIETAGLLIGAGIVAAVALRSLHDRSRRVELTTGRRAASYTFPAIVATAAGVAVLAGLVGPRIPGAGAEPLYDTKGRGGGITEVVSPLVDIRSRLTNRSDVELFRVNADSPAYWRVTTLPEFDGRTFRLPSRSLERVEGSFGDDEGGRIRQQIQVLALGGQLVPAAAEPFQATGFSGGAQLELRVNRDTNTLLAPGELAAGDLFQVVSATPALTADELRATTSLAPPDPIFLDLPDDLPSIVEELAFQVTAGTTSPYDAAIALQSWFRDPDEFSYSLEVQSGHGSNAIESFFNQRVGYCEQFSATFAAMARTLGIPSRVAVGYTPGVLNADGWYSVLGKNAHAWPELWFDGIGWVAFEPTPGRGAPGAESYTNLPPQQDETPAAGGNGQGTGAPQPTTPDTVVPAQPGAGAPTTTERVPSVGGAPLPDGGALPGLTDGSSGTAGDEPGTFPWQPFVVVGVLLSLLAVPWAVRAVRLRAARASGAAERVTVAWSRALGAAAEAGVTGRPSMTAHEWAKATAAHLPVAARPISSLAEVVDRVSFARPGTVDLERTGAYGETLGHDCELWSEQVQRIAGDTLTPSQRVKRYFTQWN